MKRSSNEKKQLLIETIGNLVKEKRKSQNKGILLFSYEYDISNSSIIALERGDRDVQLSTIWKIANALGMSFSEFVNEIEAKLPKGFKMIDD